MTSTLPINVSYSPEPLSPSILSPNLQLLTATHSSFQHVLLLLPFLSFTFIVPSLHQGQNISSILGTNSFSWLFPNPLFSIIALILWHKTPRTYIVKSDFSQRPGAQAVNTHTSYITIFCSQKFHSSRLGNSKDK